MKLLAILPVLVISQEIPLDEESKPLSERECRLYASGASYTISALMGAADLFNAFGEYREMLLMEEFSETSRQNILKAVFCEEVCEKGHTYCKGFKRDLEDEEFEQVAMFKGLMKNMDLNSKIRPPINVAKKVVGRMLSGGEVETISDEEMDELDEKIKEMITKNLSFDKIGSLVQSGLDKFGIPINFENLVGENPTALLQGAKQMWSVLQEAIKQKSGKSLNLGDIIPKGFEILKNIAKDVANKELPEIEFKATETQGQDEESEFEADVVSKDEL